MTKVENSYQCSTLKSWRGTILICVTFYYYTFTFTFHAVEIIQNHFLLSKNTPWSNLYFKILYFHIFSSHRKKRYYLKNARKFVCYSDRKFVRVTSPKSLDGLSSILQNIFAVNTILMYIMEFLMNMDYVLDLRYHTGKFW